MSLPVSNLVRVTINLSPLAAAVRSFGTLMIAGDSDVINGYERKRDYSTYEGVVADFGVDAPEAKAAALYFGQTPSPAALMIGRWLRVATSGQNIGGMLTAAEQTLSRWTVISNGSMVISINGSSQTLTGLNFTAVTNLNGVATVITAALSGATCTWDGDKFTITSATTGAGVKATGTVTFDTNAANNDTLTLNGTVITFVTGTPVGSQVLIGASKEATAANLQAFLNATVVTGLLLANYSTALGVLTITYGVVGTGGNAYTVAKSSSHITISGATLTGGVVASSVGYASAHSSGTDVSAQLQLTSAENIALVPGYDAESPAVCAAALANYSSGWYGLMFQASTQPTDEQNVAVADVIEALSVSRIFGVTITDPDVLSALVTDDLASVFKDAGYLRSFVQYSSTSDYAIASFFGRGFTVDFTASNTTINLMFKQEPGVEAEELTENEAAVLLDKRCNVFVAYSNDTTILQYGVMSGDAWWDEIHGTDWLQNALQTAGYNTLYLTTTKIPQTDQGVSQIVNALDAVMGQAVANGLVAPGTWTVGGFGELKAGDYLKTGYYIYATPIALQSQSDRDLRKSPPIQIAAKLAGAIQSINVQVDVNR